MTLMSFFWVKVHRNISWWVKFGAVGFSSLAFTRIVVSSLRSGCLLSSWFGILLDMNRRYWSTLRPESMQWKRLLKSDLILIDEVLMILVVELLEEILDKRYWLFVEMKRVLFQILLSHHIYGNRLWKLNELKICVLTEIYRLHSGN